MSQIERNSQILSKYIPSPAVNLIAHWIVDYDIKLKIKKERNTKLGDYRPPHKGLNHQITINFNLNPYSFLVTLVHEIAHLTNWNKYQNRVDPHGTEWKAEFRRMMMPFLNEIVFPSDVLQALEKHMGDPAASSCSDLRLMRTLKRYDITELRENTVHLEKVPYNSIFKYRQNRLFVKGDRIRTRFRCKEIATGNIYLFNPLTEVEFLEKENN